MIATNHDVIVYGPCREGERTVSGGIHPMSGYGWSCSCGAAGYGYESENNAGDWAAVHVGTAEVTDAKAPRS
jgi:hypothetical protein